MTYRTQSIDEYLGRIASASVAPAGGTATAVVGAIGTSLCEMVCVHSVGPDGGADEATEMEELRPELRRQREHLLALADADAAVVDELFTSAEGELDQSDVKRSIGVPLTVAVACGTVLELAEEVAANGSGNALGDVGIGVILVRSSLRAAVFTVRRNVGMVSDESFVDEVEQRAAELEVRAEDAAEGVMERLDDSS